MTPEEQFRKKRRNLMVASVLVIFINLAGAELDRINLIGNEVTFTNPNVIPIALGMLLVYTLARCLQYQHEIPDKGFKERLLSQARPHLARYLFKRELKRKNEYLLHWSEQLDLKRRPQITALSRDKTWKVASLYPHRKDVPGNISLENINVSSAELLVPFVRASLHVTLRTRLGTDYILPYVLAGAAVLTYFPFIQSWTVWL